MAKKAAKKRSRPRQPQVFYKPLLSQEAVESEFYSEFSIIVQTINSVNSFDYVYQSWRTGARGGPSTHEQQDLFRAMLIFACAGLDILVKQLIKTKLPKLTLADKGAEERFKEYVKRDLKRDEGNALNALALALIDRNPREVLLREYVGSMTSDSLQSVEELCKVSEASGLNTKVIFDVNKRNALKDAFTVRNQIIHEMDINVSTTGARTPGYRTRRQRRAEDMERHTRTILDLAQELFQAYKNKYQEYKIEAEKATR